MADMKNRPGRKIYKEPTDPRKVMMVANLRDYNNLRWRQIGEELGVTRQAPFELYKRWQDWIQKQRKAAM